jgi:hypothetical protein
MLYGQSARKDKALFFETNITRFSSVNTLIQNQLKNYNNIPEEWSTYIPDNRNYKFTSVDSNGTTMGTSRYVNFSRFVDFRGISFGLSQEVYRKNNWQSNVAGGLSFSQANYMYHIPLLRNQLTTHIGDTINDIPIYENRTYEVQAYKEVKRWGLMIQNELDYKVLDWLSISVNIRQNLWLKYTDDLSYKDGTLLDTSFYRQYNITTYYEKSAIGDYQVGFDRRKIHKPKPGEDGYQVLTRTPGFQYDLQPMLRITATPLPEIAAYMQVGAPLLYYGADFKQSEYNKRRIHIGVGLMYNL